MQQHLTTNNLLPYQEYLSVRDTYRSKMIYQRKRLALDLSSDIRIQFETVDTLQYQVQEEIYAGRINDPHIILEHAAAYSHMLPNQSSISATLFIGVNGTGALPRLMSLENIEHTIFLATNNKQRVWAEANIDVGGKSAVSPVHFLRFSFEDTPADALAIGSGQHYFATTPLPVSLLKALFP